MLRDRHAGAVRHGDAVAGRDVGVRSCRGTPCRRRRWRAASRARRQRLHRAGVAVEHVGAPARDGLRAPGRAWRRSSRSMARWRSSTRDVRLRAHRGDQRAHDLAAGGVGGVQDAAVAVAALAAEVVLGVLGAVAAARSGCRARSARGCAPAPRARPARRCRDGRGRRRRSACPRRAPRTSPRGSTPRRCRPARSSVALSGRRSLLSTRTEPWRAASQREGEAREAAADDEKIRVHARCASLSHCDRRHGKASAKFRLTEPASSTISSRRAWGGRRAVGGGRAGGCRWLPARRVGRDLHVPRPARRAAFQQRARPTPATSATCADAVALASATAAAGAASAQIDGARRKAFDPIIAEARAAAPGRCGAGQGGDPRRVRLRPVRALAEGCARADAADAGDGAPAQRLARLRAAARTSRAASATCVCCSIATMAMCAWRWPRTTPATARSTRHGGVPPYPETIEYLRAGPALPRAVPARAAERARASGRAPPADRRSDASPAKLFRCATCRTSSPSSASC